MRFPKLAIPGLLLALVLAPALTFAADDKDGDKGFTGSLSFGYRAVDQSGAADMYRQDINLDKGVRLFNFDLSYAPAGDLQSLFDRIDVHALNLGGDPYESFGLSVRKNGSYTLRYDHRKSTYYYANNDATAPGVLFDPVRFNFDRVTDAGSLGVTLTKVLSAFVNFDRYTTSGASASSYDVTGDVLDAAQPVSEKMTSMGFGLDLHVERLGLVFEQKHQNYQNVNSYFPSGPFNFTDDVSTFRLSARPLDSLILRGSAQLSKLDADVTTLDGGGAAAVATGQGAFTRKIQLFDLDLTWLLADRLAVVGEARYDTFGQAGLMTNADGTYAPDFGFKTFGVEGGLQLQLFQGFTLTGGFRYEKRTFTNAAGDAAVADTPTPDTATGPLQTVTYEDHTVRRGLYGNLSWSLKGFKLTMDYQHGSYDDPYTLMSPTSTDRFRATASYKIQGFSVAASFLSARTKNEIPSGVNFRIIYADDNYSDLWKASNDQVSLRVGYAAATFNASVGYSLINFTTDSTRLVAYNPYWTGPAGTFPWVISYQGKSTLLDATVGLALDANWKLGATAFSYQNSGFWPLEQLTLKAYLEYSFLGGFVSQLAYRYYNFKETDTELLIQNNYSAGILELSFGYRWR